MNYVIRKDYYMGQSIQDRQPLKYHIKFFEGSLPQISLGQYLNTLSHLKLLSVFRMNKEPVISNRAIS